MDSKSPRRFPVRGLLIGIVLLLLGGLLVVPTFLSNMFISGEEFCPQLFQKRDFYYYRIPGTKIRIGSTTLSTAASPCSTFILTHLAVNNPIEWQVSKASQGTRSTELGPMVLLNYLKTLNADGANAWDDWSFHKPAQAKVLWPTVQQVSEKNLYFCVPELLRTAKSETDLVSLYRKLRMICIEAAYAKTKALAENKDSQTRLKLQEWALSVIEEFNDDSDFQSRKSDFNSVGN